jgi:plastocyanin
MGPRLGALGLLGALAYAMPALAGETIRITIDKLAFSPAQVSAHVGDTVEWVSNDFIAHTATAHDKEWDVAIPAKGTARVNLQRTGEIDYFCRFHPNMTGRISVSPDLP